MIIKGLMLLIKNFLGLLLVFNLPAMPSQVQEVMTTAAGYLGDGISVLRAFLGTECLSVVASLFTVVISLHTAYFLYTAVMWILRKIPMLGLKE